MVDQLSSKRDRSSLIEKDSHLRGRTVLSLDFRKALFGMGKHGYYLLSRYAREPFQKLIDRCARFQVLKERSHRDASSAKDPCAAYLVIRALDFSAVSPIQNNEHDMLHFRNWASPPT
jgi:hypothetical protein